MTTRIPSARTISIVGGLAIATAVGPAAAVDEILVTAQRREQNLQDVPLAVSAFNASQISTLQIQEVKDIGQNVPNLQTYTVTAGAQAIQVHSRGASVQNPGFNLSESPVGVYLDDVYFGRLASVNLDLNDLERIEVLRGPQGTLYGRNTIAGAIKIISRTPGDESWASGSVGIGNYSTTKVAGSIGGPVEAGALAASMAFVYDRRNDGWQDNPVLGTDPGRYDNKAGRIKLHWYGTSNLDAVLTAWIADVENDGYNGVPYAPFSNDDIGSPNPDFDPAPPGSQPLGGFYSNFSPAGANYGGSQQGGASLALSFDFGGVTLKSISAFADVDDQFGFDLAGGGLAGVPGLGGLLITSDSDFKQWSQEFQLLGSLGERFNWQAGAFYLNEDGFQLFSGSIFGSGFAEQIGSETDSYALFAEGTFQATEAWSFTGGIRWTRDEKSFSDTCVGAFCFDDTDFVEDTPGTGFVALEDDWDEVTFKVGTDYRFSDSMLGYLSYAQGFQAGGFRTLCFGNLSSLCGGTAFDPQTVDSIEAGLKSNFFDNRLRLNLAAFYAMYEDIQQIVINSANGFPIANIGDVDVYGLELELNWSPIQDLNVYASGGYQKSDFGTVDPASPPGGLNGNAVPTSELSSNPRWQAKIGFDYTIPLDRGLAFFYGLDLYHTDNYFSESRNLVEIDSHTRLNGFLGLGAYDRQWQVALTGKNITDEKDNVSGIFANGFTNIRTPLPPVEYMLTLKFNY